jgi:fatty acid desaturase
MRKSFWKWLKECEKQEVIRFLKLFLSLMIGWFGSILIVAFALSGYLLSLIFLPFTIVLFLYAIYLLEEG